MRSRYCEECGLDYVYPHDKYYHEAYHCRYLDISDEYGRTIFYSEREKLKQGAYLILSTEGSTVPEKVAAVEQLFLAYFHRSTQSAGFDLRPRHPTLPNYCAMLLNQKHWDKRLKPYPDVHKVLLEKYGRKSGIAEGTTNYLMIDNDEIERRRLMRRAVRLLNKCGIQFYDVRS